MELTIVQLVGEWEVQVTPVPPQASFRWSKHHVKYPPKPYRPMVEIRSKLLPEGAPPEIVPALPESPEWNGWLEEMKIWQEECEHIREEMAPKEMEFSLDYAVKGWRKKGSEDEWLAEPPDGWLPSEALERHGIEDGLSVRLSFIYYELLAHPQNFDLIMAAAFPKGERDTSLISEEEVDAALSKFRSGGGMSGSAGHVGTNAGTGTQVRGAQGADEHVRRGNVSSRRKGTIARWLVRTFQRK